MAPDLRVQAFRRRHMHAISAAKAALTNQGGKWSVGSPEDVAMSEVVQDAEAQGIPLLPWPYTDAVVMAHKEAHGEQPSAVSPGGAAPPPPPAPGSAPSTGALMGDAPSGVTLSPFPPSPLASAPPSADSFVPGTPGTKAARGPRPAATEGGTPSISVDATMHEATPIAVSHACPPESSVCESSPPSNKRKTAALRTRRTDAHRGSREPSLSPVHRPVAEEHDGPPTSVQPSPSETPTGPSALTVPLSGPASVPSPATVPDALLQRAPTTVTGKAARRQRALSARSIDRPPRPSSRSPSKSMLAEPRPSGRDRPATVKAHAGPKPTHHSHPSPLRLVRDRLDGLNPRISLEQVFQRLQEKEGQCRPNTTLPTAAAPHLGDALEVVHSPSLGLPLATATNQVILYLASSRPPSETDPDPPHLAD